MKNLISKCSCWMLVLLCLSLAVPLNSTPVSSSVQAKAEWANVPKIVAVGDVHGAYDELIAILQELNLIDQHLKWTGGKTHFVQAGDSIDRGSQDKKVLDFLMDLEKQAEKAGGRVHCLIGNHEAMNIIGDLRYVTRESFAAYANNKSEDLREKTYARYVKYRVARAARNVPPQTFTPDQQFKDDWMAKHPPGYLEHRKAFSETGQYGRWVSTRNAVLRLNDTVFLHGGINEEISALSIREINDRIRQEIKTYYETRAALIRGGVLDESLDFDETVQQVANEIKYLQAKGGADDPEVLKALQQLQTQGNWFITLPTGPLWYRGYAQEPEETFQPAIDRIKANLKTAHLVVGHTPSLTGVKSRFAAGVFLIDTGILRPYYKGLCSALVIENDKFTPVYPKNGPCS
ncbi:MAG: metallophosphoesterase [Acidobacteria bacterium]|nr:metallophosphoesterase [Acidobacteriota bacterium]